MAKKRGRKKKSEPINTHELPGGWWRQIMAFLFIVLAVVFVVSWFNAGSDAVFLNFLHDAFLSLIGFTYYLVPAILVYIAVKIFRAPGNRLDPAVWVASLLMIMWFSGIFGVPSYLRENPTGGMLGAALNSLMVKELGTGVSYFIYAVLILITGMFMYAATPAELFHKLKTVFASTKSEEDAENARVMRKNSKGDDDEQPRRRGLRVNNGTGDIEEEKPKKRGILHHKDNTEEPAKAPATAPVEASPSALTAVSDPNWKMPPLSLLNKKRSPADPGDTDKNAHTIEDTLKQFGIEVDVEEANVGPRITQYTLRPPSGVKVSKIAQLDKELALSLAKDKIRIEAPIPGTRTVGVELPNEKAASVGLHELLQSPEWNKIIRDKPLSFALGKDISGKTVVGDLAKMPHLLIAGTTGSGKSVMTNTLISSLLFHNSPSDLRLIIVDPKQVEMAAYEDIPQLLTPIITDVPKALSALKWAVNEMESRYSEMAKERVKNIVDYNAKMAKTLANTPEGEEPAEKPKGKMPYIVVIVDEMADLMMMAGKELEMLIVRIAQKGRASGIHLVLATQRPEVKVVTGLIKANIPGRIAFAVNNGIDSRVMLDMTGAEKLLGSGDMLFLTTEMMGKPKRVQGAYVSDDEIANVTDFLRQQAPPNYNDEVISQQVSIKGMGGEMIESGGGGGGSLERQAMEVALQANKISTSLLQRRLGIGYGKAAALIDHLEEMGMVGPAPGGNKPREILISDISEYAE